MILGHWSHDELKALLLTPPIMFSDGSPSYPTWEGGARYFGSHYLAWPKKAQKLAAAELSAANPVPRSLLQRLLPFLLPN